MTGKTNEGTDPGWRAAGSAPRVLIVDDTELNRQLLRLVLVHLGCLVDEAPDGAAALAALACSPFDLVLMDCMMPVLDGYEACRQLRQRERASGAPRLPVAALTASTHVDERQRCLEAGMDDYLGKPFTPAQIRVLVQRWTGYPPLSGSDGSAAQASNRA